MLVILQKNNIVILRVKENIFIRINIMNKKNRKREILKKAFEQIISPQRWRGYADVG